MTRYDGHDTYCYPGCSVLRNKADLTNQTELDAFEADITAVRLVELGENPVEGQFDLQHLQRIHYALFQDVYEWAGEIRTVDISRQKSRFANARHLESYAQSLFGELAKERRLKDCNIDQAAQRLAHYLSEINAIHPFREGNGRTQRVFIAQLAQGAGYRLDYSDLEQELVYSAMEAAFHGDEKPLANLIRQRLSEL